MGAEPKVKGVAFRTIDSCFSELRGAKAHQKARELMSEEVRKPFDAGLILAASWYPIAWYREVFRAFRAATGDTLDLPRQIGHQAVKRDMASIYKMVVVRIVSPQTLLSLSSRLFNTYYDTGKFDVVESRRGYVHVRLHGCTGWDANMWSEIAGSCLSFLELAGAKEIRLRTRAGGRDNDTETELEAYWV